jgi:hypothetical protein
MKLNTNFLYITGYAGHGKDTAKLIAKENFENPFDEISMAETLKSNACALILPEHFNMSNKETAIDALNALKDNNPDYIFYANLTTRTFLQKLGTEFYRSLNDGIHTTFVASKILEKLEQSNNDLILASCDIRFPNELAFMLKLSQLKDEDLKDYLRFLQKEAGKSLPSNDIIVERFENVFNVSHTDPRTKLILDSILNSTDKLKNVADYKQSWDLQVPDTSKMTKEQAIQFGLLNVFRPIINPNVDYNKNLKTQELVEEIKKYTGLEYGKVADIMKYYKVSELDFNVENVRNYGYLRADIRHPSENAVNHLKPEPILSTPLKDSKFKQELLTLLNTIVVKDENKMDAKKKNLINRGV